MSHRVSLPSRRRTITWGVHIGAKEVFLACGLYPDGSLGEIFLVVGKGDERDWCNDWAMMFSMALQHGTPLATLVDLYVHSDSNPRGPVRGHPRIRRCTSIASFVVRALAVEFLGREDLADTAPAAEKVAGPVVAGSGF